MSNFQVIDLGKKEYKETLEIQYEYLDKVYKKEQPNTLLIVEHHHVITMGRKAEKNNLLTKDIPIHYIKRGGDVTYHGPGQLVGYPIIDISDNNNIHKYIRNLEKVLIDLLDYFDIQSGRREKFTGVWTNKKKIVSIGVAFKKWISYHGFALNVSPDLNYFFKINPCGLDAQIMTSMKKVLGKEILLEDVKKVLVEKFAKDFFNY